ncbi:MAG: DegT/DnrJ/EryC1/StrS family aminotransferase [Sphingobacteriales bacterium]|nr:DegT/DnrJ/EryC1/StrS family aminotransferase [Sphingobacteriales bacterium]
MIPYEDLGKLNQPFFEAYQESFKKTLESGWYILGKEVVEFETAFADYVKSPYGVGLASGLDALVIALKVLELPQNAEVIVPSNTYIATVLAVINAGFKPVLVEPNLATYNIDADLIEEKITSNTKAIMLTHLYGKVCEMDKIEAICKKHQLFLIEDCAQAHGAKFKGQQAGTFGEFGAFSFYPTKNLGALGDAGALTMKNEAHFKKVKSLRNYGSAIKYHNDDIGFNSRLDEVQAGFLSIKLKHLDAITLHKQALAKLYFEGLKEDFIKPQQHPDYEDVFHIFNIRHPKRDQLKQYLLENGIGTEIHYPIPPHQQKGYLEFFQGESYPIAEEIHQTTLSLPISFAHTEQDIEKVIEVMNRF